MATASAAAAVAVEKLKAGTNSAAPEQPSAAGTAASRAAPATTKTAPAAAVAEISGAGLLLL